MSKTTESIARRREILSQLAGLTSIERGTLKEEYRERPAASGRGVIRTGPYYKHQCWERGANRSSRIPASEVENFRKDLDRGLEFGRLVEELASLAIDAAREQRGGSGRRTPGPRGSS